MKNKKIYEQKTIRNQYMKYPYLLLLCYLMGGIVACQSVKESSYTRTEDFNFDWQFLLNEEGDFSTTTVDDANWRTLNLPHDWSVEAPFDSINGEGCTAYLPGGLGWYRKHFVTKKADDQKVFVLFDGIYNNSEVWLNGIKLGNRPYGYVPFYFDLTPHLAPQGQDNVIAVKVDHTRYADSRWYTGSGIYRNVQLITTSKLHIPIWGTFVSTPEVTTDQATVQIEVKLQNDFAENQNLTLQTEIFDPSGNKVATTQSELTVAANSSEIIQQQLKLGKPSLWDIDHPHLYQAVNTIVQGDKKVENHTTTFGVRSFRFDVNEGFFLNGKNRKIKGVCLHHDAGLVGAAVPKGVWRRRFETLKAGGCNAIRIAHNPGSEEFLGLCNEMGFLVQDEFFDEWDYPKDKRLNKWETKVDSITQGYGQHFQAWAERDLKTTVLAHRNHPSIIQWSIGNEIEWTYPRNAASTGFFDPQATGNYFWTQPPNSIEKIRELQQTLPRKEYDIGKTGQKLAKWTRELDTTRPVIANCILPSASYESGLADALDIIGYSYRRVMYDYGKKNYPDLPLMGTESLGHYHEWKAIRERPFVSGTFLWTGISYLGESNGQWPSKAVNSGLLDLAGFPHPTYYMYKTMWTDEPHIYITSQTPNKSLFKLDEKGEPVEKNPGKWQRMIWGWQDVNVHWNYRPEEMVIVEVLSSCEEVELFLNDLSLGKKRLDQFDDHIYKWAVPFAAGELTAVGTKAGQEVRTSIKTATTPTKITVQPDKKTLQADGYDVAHLVVQLVDQAGNPVKHQNQKVHFELTDGINSLGVDTGASSNVQPFQANQLLTDKGRALLIVQAGRKAANATVTVTGDGLEPALVNLILK
ncbi:MAG: sugar-binding domain-containing protein [Bacteroidota bacterium]